MNNDTITLKGALGIYSYFLLFPIYVGVVDSNYQEQPIREYSPIIMQKSIANLGENIVLKSTTNIDSDYGIIQSFVSSIVDNMQPLEGEIADIVNENFWDMI